METAALCTAMCIHHNENSLLIAHSISKCAFMLFMKTFIIFLHSHGKSKRHHLLWGGQNIYLLLIKHTTGVVCLSYTDKYPGWPEYLYVVNQAHHGVVCLSYTDKYPGGPEYLYVVNQAHHGVVCLSYTDKYPGGPEYLSVVNQAHHGVVCLSYTDKYPCGSYHHSLAVNVTLKFFSTGVR